MEQTKDSNFKMNYTFSDKNKKIAFALMGVGAISLIASFITDPHRAWPNLLVNSFFFMAIALGALFFMAVQYASEAGWSAVIKRVPEAVAHFLPFGAVAVLIVVLASAFHLNHLYHWMDASLYDINSPHYDKIIAGKRAFLNPTFFVIRTVVYLGGWVLFFRAFMKKSRIEESNLDVPNYRKSVSLAAWFLVFFAVTSSTSAWDWLMSIDTHWFSTLFGWYVFAGMFVSALTMITLIVLHLKNQGLLPEVNENHIHDLGKFMFAFSIFWTYLWFSQFMLIWYANIPEEVTYFMDRFENYKFIFMANLFINFIFPFIVLMTRGAKRNFKLLFFVGCVILIGHWSDTFVMVMPGTVKDHWHLGWAEIGTALGFLGFFGYVVLTALAKRPVSNPKHVFYEESVHHHI
jgi:hypothetical protein